MCGEAWRQQAGSGTVSQSLALTSASTNAADCHCWSTTYHLPSLTFMPHQHDVEATYRRTLRRALAGVSDHFTAGGVKLTSGCTLTSADFYQTWRGHSSSRRIGPRMSINYTVPSLPIHDFHQTHLSEIATPVSTSNTTTPSSEYEPMMTFIWTGS